MLMAGYRLGDGSIDSLTTLQQNFIALVESKDIELRLACAGIAPEEQQKVETISVTEYADRLEIVRKNNPGVLERITT